MRRDETFSLGRFSFWEVELGDGALDPNIDRKSVLKSVGKKQDAIGDFFADAMEFAESFARRNGGNSSK